MNKKFFAVLASYVVISFITGFSWFLVLFKEQYQSLGVYNLEEPIFAFGIGSMIIQGAVIAYLFPLFIRGGNTIKDGLKFAGLVSVFMWSLNVLAVAAKTPITSLSTWFVLGTGFHVVVFILLGIALGLIYRTRV